MQVDFDYLNLNKSCTPGRKFEQFTCLVLDVLGFTDIKFTGAEGSSEEGADFTAERNIELFPGRFFPTHWGVQSKCIAKPERQVQKIERQLHEMMRLKKCDHLLLVLATDPSDKFRKILDDWANEHGIALQIIGKSDLDLLANKNTRLANWLYDRIDKESIESQCYNSLYHLGPNHAQAVRLIGAADEYFPPESVTITIKTTAYKMPLEFKTQRKEIIRHLRREKKQSGEMFYNGPNTRLLDYWATPVNHTEKKHLELVLGPIGWYDFSVVNHCLGLPHRKTSPKDIEQYIDLKELSESGIIRDIRLTNLLDTATTLVTKEGLAIYSRRSHRVSLEQGCFTSCVAENIHQIKDRSLHKPQRDALPALFRTVLRGISEELSKRLAMRVTVHSIYLLGLSFDLHTFHPDALFMVVLPISWDEIQEMCIQHPGHDFIEGRIKAVEVQRTSTDLNSLLTRPDWVAGGKASLIRTIEFLEVIRSESGLTIKDIVESLANGEYSRIFK